MATWECEWLGDWWPRFGLSAKWDRGFVAGITINDADLSRCGEALFGAHPIVVVHGHGPTNRSGRVVADLREHAGLSPVEARNAIDQSARR